MEGRDVGKNPAFQFYPGDWTKDPKVSLCKPATRGIWMDALCAMHEMDHCGQLSGTLESISRVCRCRADEMRAAIDDLRATGAADVTECNANVILVNRRMQREYNSNTQNRLRVSKWREKRIGNEDVMPPSSKDTKHTKDSPSKKEPPIAPPGAFERFWKIYPRKIGKGAAEKAWARMKPPVDTVLAAVEAQGHSEQWQRDGGQFIPYPATWLNQKRWEDEVQDGANIKRAGVSRGNTASTKSQTAGAQGYERDIERGRRFDKAHGLGNE